MTADPSPADGRPSANPAPLLPLGDGDSPRNRQAEGRPSPLHKPDEEIRIQQGAAVTRHGSCLPDTESNCARDTTPPISPCCPRQLTCQGTGHFHCCPPRTDCAPERLCANSSWALYKLDEYFCCAAGTRGYNNDGHGVCASPGAAFVHGKPALPALSIDPGEFAMWNCAARRADGADTRVAAAPSLSPPLKDGPMRLDSHSNGAIVGGILGAILGVAIVVRVGVVVTRHRRRSRVKIVPAGDERGAVGNDDTDHAGGLRPCDSSPAGLQRLAKETLSHTPSFELQWTAIQSPRNTGPAASRAT